MSEWLQDAYLWLKAIHVIFVIFWMAGLFAFPRFLVYHQEAVADPAECARWVERESKLRHIILTPSMIIVWVLGLALIETLGVWSAGWVHAKLTVVFLLTAYHGWMIGYAKRLQRGSDQLLTGKQLRLINEVPGIATIVIVLLVILKPF
jgi:putative membrane protein